MPNVDPNTLPSYPNAYGGKEVSQALANAEVTAALGGSAKQSKFITMARCFDLVCQFPPTLY